MRERIEREGIFSLAPHEVLEVFLFDVIPRRNTNSTAHLLLDRFGTLNGVFNASVEELTEVEGIGETTADYIKNSYNTFLNDCRKQMLRGPVISFEHLSSLLLFHRDKFSDKPFTVILLSCEMEVVRVIDTDRLDSVSSEECSGHRMIIAASSDRLREAMDFRVDNAELVDVIEIDGLCVKSCIRFPEK